MLYTLRIKKCRSHFKAWKNLWVGKKQQKCLIALLVKSLVISLHSLGLSPHALTAAPCTVACYIKFLLLYKEKQINFNSEKT